METFVGNTGIFEKAKVPPRRICNRHVLTLEVASRSDTSRKPRTCSRTSFGSTASVTLASGPAYSVAWSSYSGPGVGVLLPPSAPPAASMGWRQSIACGYAAASPTPHASPSPSPLSLKCSHGGRGGDIGGAGWASAAGPGVDGVPAAVAGRGTSGPTGAEACRGRCGGGEAWSLAAQQAEQARLRLGAGFGGSEGGDVTGETAAAGVVGHGICVDRVRWLAWWASCVDCVSSCGSTVPAVARVGEAGAGWEQRGVAESMSLAAVGYRGLRCAMGHATGCRLQRGRVRCRGRESAASVDQSVG